MTHATGPIARDFTAPPVSPQPQPDSGTTQPSLRAAEATWFDRDADDFSVVLGGPLYQLFLRTRMVRPPLELLWRRVIVLAGIAWLPLLLLSVLVGRAWGGVKIPFLADVDLHVRFLVSLPLLVIAEQLVHRRMRPIVGEFLRRDVIRPEQRDAFHEILVSCLRWRNSTAIEVAMLLFCLTVGHWLWRAQIAIPVPTWYANVTPGGGVDLTLPGAYFAFVSVPLFQFILLRWYYRLVIWCRFLWKVSRLDLHLVPTHPDRCGGLGFLQGSAFALLPILLAHTALLAGLIGNRILHEGDTLPDYKLEIVIITAGMLLLAFGPLTVFALRLAACRRDGLREYGRLASRYVGDFERKWLVDAANGQSATTVMPPPASAPGDDRPAAPEPFLGSADLQSLADLGNSFGVVREMQIFPFARQTVIRLAIAVLIPLAPLVLTMIPLNELFNRLLKTLI